MVRLETSFQVRPMSGNIGAEVFGIDIRDVSDEVVAELREAWLEHLVLILVGQEEADPSDLGAFARRFGEPYRHILFPDTADPVHAINVPAGGFWHSDVTFAEEPPIATMLHARRLPAKGGDTMWANMYLAYETLSFAMQKFVAGLTARHDFDHFYRYPMGDSLETDQFVLDQKRLFPLPAHPVVRRHPETGREALYVNESFTTRIEELSPSESDAILELLNAHSTRPELTCRHRWSVGDLAFWDNRCTMHYPIDDWAGSFATPGQSSRQMNRVTIQAERPVAD
ncbi:MAG: putative alpha-ketoglutarate-dependent sulfonate dioxygenase-like [Actinomycetia bacterium]|nr:putative alpha-ketoglutarate-dependent sulfonate dioxygenase-like [Actinomycetes bacterium]